MRLKVKIWKAKDKINLLSKSKEHKIVINFYFIINYLQTKRYCQKEIHLIEIMQRVKVKVLLNNKC